MFASHIASSMVHLNIIQSYKQGVPERTREEDVIENMTEKHFTSFVSISLTEP